MIAVEPVSHIRTDAQGRAWLDDTNVKGSVNGIGIFPFGADVTAKQVSLLTLFH